MNTANMIKKDITSVAHQPPHKTNKACKMTNLKQLLIYSLASDIGGRIMLFQISQTIPSFKHLDRVNLKVRHQGNFIIRIIMDRRFC